jgi:hypothetical protein
MSDYTLPPCSTLIVGMSGSGKTTFALRGLLNLRKDCACIFIFDEMGQACARLYPVLGCYHASTAWQLEEALKSRIVIFNPHPMFPGRVEAGFRFFCEWVMDCCRRPGARGHKILLVDEAWRFQTPQGIPRELAAVSQMGRAEDLELMICTQLPHKLHASITGQSTELVCFRLDERLALESVRELGADPETVRNLPLGQFIALNRLNRTRLEGSVF